MNEKNIQKISFFLFTLKFLSLSTSLIVLALSAHFFGISSERDVWVLVTSFFLALTNALFGPINETFRAKYISLKEELASSILENQVRKLVGFIIVVACVVSIFIFSFSELIKDILFPNPTLTSSILFTKMMVILIPTFIINQIITLSISILNTYNVFYIPEIVSLVASIINIVSIYILTKYIGIYSLIVSQYISLIIYGLIVIFFLNKNNIRITPIFYFKWGDISPYIIFSLPFFIPYLFGQVSSILEKTLAVSFGDGVLSILDYSKKFIIILQTVLTSVLASIMVSDLTKSYTNKDLLSYSVNHKKYFEIFLLILSLSLPILIGSSSLISKFLFMHGDLSSEAISSITRMSQFYGFAFIGISLYLFTGLTLLSQLKAKHYALIGVFTQIFVIIFNLSFYKILKEYTFPISSGISHFFSAIIMQLFIKNIEKKFYCALFIKVLIFILILVFFLRIEIFYLHEFSDFICIVINCLTVLLLIFLFMLPLLNINILKIKKS